MAKKEVSELTDGKNSVSKVTLLSLFGGLKFVVKPGTMDRERDHNGVVKWFKRDPESAIKFKKGFYFASPETYQSVAEALKSAGYVDANGDVKWSSTDIYPRDQLRKDLKSKDKATRLDAQSWLEKRERKVGVDVNMRSLIDRTAIV